MQHLHSRNKRTTSTHLFVTACAAYHTVQHTHTHTKQYVMRKHIAKHAMVGFPLQLASMGLVHVQAYAVQNAACQVSNTNTVVPETAAPGDDTHCLTVHVAVSYKKN